MRLRTHTHTHIHTGTHTHIRICTHTLSHIHRQVIDKMQRPPYCHFRNNSRPITHFFILFWTFHWHISEHHHSYAFVALPFFGVLGRRGTMCFTPDVVHFSLSPSLSLSLPPSLCFMFLFFERSTGCRDVGLELGLSALNKCVTAFKHFVCVYGEGPCSKGSVSLFVVLHVLVPWCWFIRRLVLELNVIRPFLSDFGAHKLWNAVKGRKWIIVQ